MSRAFPVIDLFAGPGGLGEGFSAFRDRDGHHPFHIALSVEKDASAFETLRLRSFLRQFQKGFPKEYYEFINRELPEPDWGTLYPLQWKTTSDEVFMLELGTSNARELLLPRLNEIRKKSSEAIVIGGPPCQAYSLVGRARNLGIKGYKARDDHRHFLYREYIAVIRQLQPAVFVMENVTGMISSSVDGKEIFNLVLSDLREAGGTSGSYRLFALVPGPQGMKLAYPAGQRSFVVRAEDFGVPQARHRVIIIGVRWDIDVRGAIISEKTQNEPHAKRMVARSVLTGLPMLRSGLSRNDGDMPWVKEVSACLTRISELCESTSDLKDIAKRALQLRRKFDRIGAALTRRTSKRPSIGKDAAPRLKRWVLDRHLRLAPNNETRTHMPSDLMRYMFASIFGEVRGQSTKSSDFPKELSPAHRNWRTGKFSDRFRVQLYDRASSTITSHISKDGHYFIHPDPMQCRSLTVREAARLQTFPDNYLFKGNRTEQYVQVGNAVPPYLAVQIAEVVNDILRKHLS